MISGEQSGYSQVPPAAWLVWLRTEQSLSVKGAWFRPVDVLLGSPTPG